MTLQDVLKFADNLVFEKTGKHLDNLQEAVIRGAYQGQSYTTIGKENNCTSGHISDTAYKLWQLLSNLLGEDINKNNFRSVLERYTVSSVSVSYTNYVLQINNNSSLNTINVEKTGNQDHLQQEKYFNLKNYDLKELPQATSFYGRNQELNQLQKWITNKSINLILLYGLKGIGKTSLIIQLINLVKNEFNLIAYFDFKINSCLETIEKRILELVLTVDNSDNNIDGFSQACLKQNFNELYLQHPTERRTKLLEILREYRCLIIFDHIQDIYSQENEESYQDLKIFFQQIGQLEHQSCLLLSSSENLRDLADLSVNYASVKLLQLQGLENLAARQLLEEKGITNNENIDQLINIYQAHPSWLKQIANVIQNLLDGDISLILKNNSVFIADTMKQEFKVIFSQLSASDKQILITLANSEQSLTVSDIFKQLSLSVDEVINGLQRLCDRVLIYKQDNYFQINPLIKIYYISDS